MFAALKCFVLCLLTDGSPFFHLFLSFVSEKIRFFHFKGGVVQVDGGGGGLGEQPRDNKRIVPGGGGGTRYAPGFRERGEGLYISGSCSLVYYRQGRVWLARNAACASVPVGGGVLFLPAYCPSCPFTRASCGLWHVSTPPPPTFLTYIYIYTMHI